MTKWIQGLLGFRRWAFRIETWATEDTLLFLVYERLDSESPNNGPTNPTNKSQTNHKRKRNSRSKGLRQSAVPGADRPYGGGRPSTRARRTVRGFTVNYPKMPPEPPVAHPEKHTVRTLPLDRLRSRDCSRSPRELSAKPCATRSNRIDGSNQERARTSDELDEQSGNMDCPRLPG
jgi:hypothetical protein